jgi:hypothetical protein
MRRLEPRRRALPLLHRSYELMRQTKFLPVASVLPIPRGLCRLSSVPAARWSFPTLALRVFSWMLGPVPRRSCEVHVLVSSLTTSAFPERHERVGDHNHPLSDFRAGSFFAAVVIPNVLASKFACHPGRSYRCSRYLTYRAAVAFTSEQNTCRCLHVHRIC